MKELQDYNIFEQRLSTYRTNHIHLYLDGVFDLDFNKMSLRDFASLVHEYVLYLQPGCFGICITGAFQQDFIPCRKI